MMSHRWYRPILLVCLVGIVVIVCMFAKQWFRLMHQPMVPISQIKPVYISLDKNESASTLGYKLLRNQLIPSNKAFISLVRLKGLSHQLKAGVYQIIPGESTMQFVNRVVNGDVVRETFSIIEGTTQHQVSENLKRAPWLNYHITDWQDFKTEHHSAEGMLLADTYFYNAGSDARNLLKQAHGSLTRYLEKSWQHRAPGLPYKSPYEMLIAASIIEKETAIPHERRLIAGVIINRLTNNMLLQVDPTVIYALGAGHNGPLTHDNLLIDSPYNTYRYRGLPPTPIAMVGRDAIDAAANPERSNYLYFVAKGDGSHHFSVTYDEQKQAIGRYLRNKI